jgi:hypothetical protein
MRTFEGRMEELVEALAAVFSWGFQRAFFRTQLTSCPFGKNGYYF